MTSSELGLDSSDLSTQGNAQNALTSISEAQNQITSTRANIGSLVNRFGRASENLGVSAENLTATFSSLRDLDVASETSKLSQNLTLKQAGLKALSQSNKLASDIGGSLIDISV